MPVKGDFKKLTYWELLFRNAVTLVETQSAELATEMVALVKEGFDTESDPYGRKWAPKKRPDGRKVLTGKTGRLGSGWHVVSALRRGFHIAASVDYAAPHQDPRDGRRPARLMVPVMSLGLPARWQARMVPVALAAAGRYFGATGGQRLRRTFRKV